jgi:hypothetical protein
MKEACLEKNPLDVCTASLMNDMLFKCEEGVINRIYLTESSCNGRCKDGGSGKSDYC